MLTGLGIKMFLETKLGHFEILWTWLVWGSKTWALTMGLSTTIYQQYVRGEEIIGKPRNQQ